MLGIVVAKERPDLEEQKSQLVRRNDSQRSPFVDSGLHIFLLFRRPRQQVKDNAKMNKQLKEIEDT